MAELEMYTFRADCWVHRETVTKHTQMLNNGIDIHTPAAVQMFFVHYLGVGDADDTFYETILLCDLEDRHTVLPILLHPLGATIRPVLVAHLLQ